MHEVSVMQSALDTALTLAQQEGAKTIQRVTLRVGELSGVVPDALRFAFDVVTRDTMAEGAELKIEEVPAACYCAACRREFAFADAGCCCPDCGRISRDIRRGRELSLAWMEVV